jgi:hypothetical protein
MNTTKKEETKTQQELQIQKALRTGGFLFPETVKEVIDFENNFGNTDVILPEELKTPTFLDSISEVNSVKRLTAHTNENYSLAARDGKNELPIHIRLKMKEDRAKHDAKEKRKK